MGMFDGDVTPLVPRFAEQAQEPARPKPCTDCGDKEHDVLDLMLDGIATVQRGQRRILATQKQRDYLLCFAVVMSCLIYLEVKRRG